MCCNLVHEAIPKCLLLQSFLSTKLPNLGSLLEN